MNFFKWEYPKKGDVRKVWDPTTKTWDYEIVGEENWKPKGNEYVTKKMLEHDPYSQWFDKKSLSTLDDVQKYKESLRSEILDYVKQNEFKRELSIKKYKMSEILEQYFFFFIKRYPKKDIFRCSKILEEIYVDNPSLERLKYLVRPDVPDELVELSGENLGVVNYWVFKDAVIFRN